MKIRCSYIPWFCDSLHGVFFLGGRGWVDGDHFVVHVSAKLGFNLFNLKNICQNTFADYLLKLTSLFTLAFSSSSSKYVRTPILQSMMEGRVKEDRQSCNWMNSKKK